MKTIEKGPTLGEQVFEYIREGIVTERLRAGQVLVESELAQELKVSRTPVSNAVIMLKERGLMEERGGKLVVLDLSIHDVIELYQCRLAFDGLAARLAADRITPAQLEALSARMDAWRTVIEVTDTHALWVADLGFHAAVYEASCNKHLRRFSEMATDLLSTYRRVILENLTSHPDQYRSAADVRQEHQAICDALLVRDADAAEGAARAHIGNVIAFLERARARSAGRSAAQTGASTGAGAGLRDSEMTRAGR